MLACMTSAPASAQLSRPCGATCGIVLGATGLTFATGTLVTYTRFTGGVGTPNEALRIFGVSFGAFVGGAVALSGNGERQERAVYSAGLGAVVGSIVWLALESSRGQSTGARRLAATLMGAAAGALAGGVYGALSYDGDPLAPGASFSVSVPF